MTETERGSDLPRRRFLVAAGAAVALGAVVPSPAFRSIRKVWAADDLAAAPTVPSGSPHRWVMVIDLRKCDGCKKCTTACQEMHHLQPNQEWIRVYDLTDASGTTYHMPVLCQQCDHAPCVNVCPVRATYHRDDGVVVVDQSVCIGCRMCMAACPYAARTFNWTAGSAVPAAERNDDPAFTLPQRIGTVGKCTFCVHRTANGQLPSCVEACNMEALYLGDRSADAATNGQQTVVLSRFLRDNHAYRFKDDLGTEPNVYYIAGHGENLGY